MAKKLYHFSDNLSHEWVLVEASDAPSAWKKLQKHLKKCDWASDDGYDADDIQHITTCFDMEKPKVVK